MTDDEINEYVTLHRQIAREQDANDCHGSADSHRLSARFVEVHRRRPATYDEFTAWLSALTEDEWDLIYD